MTETQRLPTLPVSRRDFLRASGALAIALPLARIAAPGCAAQEARSADQVVAGKNPGLLVHNPLVGELETPLDLLRKHALTPKDLLFVRNNQVLPRVMTTESPPPGPWEIECVGLLEAPAKLSLERLLKMDSVEHELVLQCSGNGRSRFSRAAKVEGAPWGQGAMGNVRFRGVPLKHVLEQLRVVIQPAAKFLAAEGRDAPSKPEAADFEHSLPLADVLERSILATHLNGEPLPRVHGGPVRLVTPGYYATMNVKWLSRLRFEAVESSNHHHVPRYRTPLRSISPGSPFEATLENSEPNWNMRIKSVIFSPLAGERLGAGQDFTISGVAWNDGAAKLETVEVSADGGQSWRRADLAPAGRFAWHPWKLALRLPAGKHTLYSRAIDALGRAQPFDGSIHWNPAGYTWNGVDEVQVEVS